MFALYRTLPSPAPADGPSSTTASVGSKTAGAAGRPARPRLVDVVIDALEATRRGRGD